MKKKSKNSDFDRILDDIRSVRIQGAENIAKSGIKAFLLRPGKKSLKKIIGTRPTEPLLQNALYHISKSKNQREEAKVFLKELENAHEKISKEGADLIKDDMNIYVHCHSSTVIDILRHAKRKQKKKFVIYTTEVEPLLQGRKTAEDLAKAKIKVIISPDLAAEQSLSKCDLFLFGADAFSKKAVANKIGTSTLCKLAKSYNIPVYSCGVSLKFTKRIRLEQRPSQEVWATKNNKIKVINPAFDLTKMKDLTGIISEFGILSTKEFVKKAKEKIKSL